MNRPGWISRSSIVLATMAAGLAMGAMLAPSAAVPSDAALAMAGTASPVANPSPAAAPAPIPAPESMKIVPAEGGKETGGKEVKETKPSPAVKKKKKKVVHRAAPVRVEEANDRLRIKESTWIYSGPSNRSRHIVHAPAGKFVVVTGATRHFLRVKLQNGETGYIPTSTVELVKPTDQIFQLTSDAPVRAEPNRWAKKVAEVHKGHKVHVVGVSLSYMQIKMKSGLVGFIPATALQ